MATATGDEATRLDVALQPGASMRFTVDVGQTALGSGSAKMEIKSLSRFPVVLLTLTEGGGLTTDAATGIISVDATPAQTVLIVENSTYDLLFLYQDTSVDKLRLGTITLQRPVTAL